LRPGFLIHLKKIKKLANFIPKKLAKLVELTLGQNNNNNKIPKIPKFSKETKSFVGKKLLVKTQGGGRAILENDCGFNPHIKSKLKQCFSILNFVDVAKVTIINRKLWKINKWL
jgi:hypothetical protein